MDQAILDGDPPVSVVLRRSARARRLSLRVSRLDGRVTLSLPPRASERAAMAFLREKESWIRDNLEQLPVGRVASIGSTVPFLGQDVSVVVGTGRAARLEGDRLLVPNAPNMVGPRIEAFLKLQAKTYLRAASDKYAKALDTDYARLTIRDTRSRWGSCTSDGNLMYSWRLVMAPIAVLDYVAAHEVAHRLEMNHSDRFWTHVARVCPDYAMHRDWLRTEGQVLHAWQFKGLDGSNGA
ncbi:M48 family metallopeptidase [Pacificibacter marinus]|uniref:M48 family metallopeptidase n=1 Tax=Pacificibacter marinus TaxID=658057 RepID=UPI001C06A88F|nr:SprT family zinc-dependent metalloprotease [Pacificibacter marinus]MBU2868750.1 M48 family metallopeptidase [Pacificibacter marinus]